MIVLAFESLTSFNEFMQILKAHNKTFVALELTMEITNKGTEETPYYVINFHYSDDKAGMVRNFLAKIIANHLVSFYVWRDFSRMIKDVASDFSGEDVAKLIIESSKNFGKLSESCDLLNLTSSTEQVFAIRDFLETGYMDILGFYSFQLKDIRRDLAISIEKALEERLAKEDYLEFIGIIKRMLRLHPNPCEYLKVNFFLFGGYEIIDESGVLKKRHLLIEDNNEIQESLIEILITLAPKNLELSYFGINPPRITQALNDIWQEKFNLIQNNNFTNEVVDNKRK